MKLHNFFKLNSIALAAIVVLLNLSTSSAQHYQWAHNVPFETRGSFGSFVGSDFHGNGIFKGTFSSCLTCMSHYARAYDVTGQVVWTVSVFGIAGNVPSILSVSTDYANNKYVLFDNPQGLPLVFGTFSTSYLRFIVKYDAAGAVVRLTNLNDPYFKIVADSSGNMFITSGSKTRRYATNGTIEWTKINPTVSDILVDRYKNCFIVEATRVVKYTPDGTLIYQRPFSGVVRIDLEGRLLIQDQSGLRKWNKTGFLLWHRPTIIDPFQINENGNIYEFTSDSIRKYNRDGDVLQWTFEKIANGIVNMSGDIFVGSNYNPFTTDVQPCPFRIAMLPLFAPMEADQAWVGMIKGSGTIPFQAGVYTNQIEFVCSSTLISDFASPGLFTFCTNKVSELDSSNVYSVQLSDINGDFTNPIDLGPVEDAVVPDNIVYGNNYRVRVVASTPGVTSHPNTPNLNDWGITLIPNPGPLSISGSLTICQGLNINLKVIPGTHTGSIDWYNNGTLLNLPAMTKKINPDSSGIYYAIVTNDICTRHTDSLNLTVLPSPHPVITPTGPLFMCVGDTVELTVNDTELPLIRWRKDGISISGAMDTNYFATTAGLYTSRIILANGCATWSDPVEVIVNCRQGQITEASLSGMYPNPVVDILYINNQDLAIGEATIQIFDISGKLIMNEKVNISNSQIEVNLSHLNSGVYMVKLNSDEQSFKNVFVKQ